VAASCFGSRSSTCINTLAVASLAFLATKGLEPPHDETDEIYGLARIFHRSHPSPPRKLDRYSSKSAASWAVMSLSNRSGIIDLSIGSRVSTSSDLAKDTDLAKETWPKTQTWPRKTSRVRRFETWPKTQTWPRKTSQVRRFNPGVLVDLEDLAKDTDLAKED